jgi:CO/xanthine dehydrogenase Mo-binding subunit
MNPRSSEMLDLRPAAIDRGARDRAAGEVCCGAIEAWPAAGGGLLVGAAEASCAGAAPRRPRVKTIFIRIDAGGAIAVLLPYVALEDAASACVRALVAEELFLSENRVEVCTRRREGAVEGRLGSCPNVSADLAPALERSLRACAAVAHRLLIAAAAERWAVPRKFCRLADGMVHAGRRSVAWGMLAGDAALCELPDRIRLRSGLDIRLVPTFSD